MSPYSLSPLRLLVGLSLLFVVAIVPSVAAAQAGRKVDPEAVSLALTDLPPGFQVDPARTSRETVANGVAEAYSVWFERELSPASAFDGPFAVHQAVFIARVADGAGLASLLAGDRNRKVTEEGYALIPGAPNDGGTASLYRVDGSVVAYSVAFVKQEMLAITTVLGMDGLLDWQAALSLAGKSSARYDLAVAGLLPPLEPRASTSPQLLPARAAAPTAVLATTKVTVDPRLAQSWRALIGLNQTLPDGVAIGTLFQDIAEQAGVRIAVGPLPARAAGQFNPQINTVTVNLGLMNEDYRVLGSIIAHELMHVHQTAQGLGGTRDCVRMEVQAFMMEAVVWGSFWPRPAPGARPALPARTPMEKALTDQFTILTTEGEPGFYRMVVDGRGYQRQCDLWVPTE